MSYLNQIRQQTAQLGSRDPNGDFVLPPVLPGQYAPQSKVLAKLTRRQLVDLARAWAIDIDVDGTKPMILPIMEAAEMRGVFNQAPKNKYYFHKAKYSSDQIKDAKAHGGFLRDQYGTYSVPCDILFPWRGDDPEADRQAPKPKAEVSEGSREFDELRAIAATLGIKTWGKGKEELRKLITEAKAGTPDTLPPAA